MTDNNNIRDAAEAIKGIVEAVPIYEDLVQPAAREIGTALQTVTKTLHILLAPISSLVWGYDKIKDFVSVKVAEKLEGVPEQQLRSPEPHVAGPVLEALRYTGYQEALRDMYANLLATSIDSNTATQAHPAFVEIIRQMSPDEALIVKVLAQTGNAPKIDLRAEEKTSSLGHWRHRNFTLVPYDAGCTSPQLGSHYMINLQRLGLIELRETYHLQGDDGIDLYQPLLEHAEIKATKTLLDSSADKKLDINYGAAMLTDLGKQFCFACVIAGTHVQNPTP
jgi:Abortive infection alpha